jgi:hypothetical protein
VSFGRRVALFFVLIAIVPMAALIAVTKAKPSVDQPRHRRETGRRATRRR